jgi:acyl-CoA synthetase (AMP-forming)/AMP-acid ligase II
MGTFPLFERAQLHADRSALREGDNVFSYRQLTDRADRVAAALLGVGKDLEEKRIGVLIPPGVDYVAAQWGVWRAGGIFVPLSLSATPKEISYALADAEIGCLVTTKELAGDLQATEALRLVDIAEALQVLAVPVAAVLRSADGDEVRIVNDAGTITRVKVTIGLIDGEWVEIKDGLKGDELVVVDIAAGNVASAA